MKKDNKVCINKLFLFFVLLGFFILGLIYLSRYTNNQKITTNSRADEITNNIKFTLHPVGSTVTTNDTIIDFNNLKSLYVLNQKEYFEITPSTDISSKWAQISLKDNYSTNKPSVSCSISSQKIINRSFCLGSEPFSIYYMFNGQFTYTFSLGYKTPVGEDKIITKTVNIKVIPSPLISVKFTLHPVGSTVTTNDVIIDFDNLEPVYILNQSAYDISPLTNIKSLFGSISLNNQGANCSLAVGSFPKTINRSFCPSTLSVFYEFKGQNNYTFSLGYMTPDAVNKTVKKVIKIKVVPPLSLPIVNSVKFTLHPVGSTVTTNDTIIDFNNLKSLYVLNQKEYFEITPSTDISSKWAQISLKDNYSTNKPSVSCSISSQKIINRSFCLGSEPFSIYYMFNGQFTYTFSLGYKTPVGEDKIITKTVNIKVQ